MSLEHAMTIIGGGNSEAQQQLNEFWPKALEEIKGLKQNDFKTQELPLARIKKIMKLDEDVKMISAEAPALFAKAAEFFISELTLRAWIHAEDNKRRTLQRNDIAMAITKYDQFDFLIDIVPREEVRPAKRPDDGVVRAVVNADQVQYYFQMANQQPTVQQAAPQTIQLQAPMQIQQPIQILTGNSAAQVSALLTQPQQQQHISVESPSHMIQIQQQTTGTVQQASAMVPQTMQVYTQVVTPSGEVQQIPIQLTPSQIQAITQQLQGKQPNQPIVIQTSMDDAADAAGQQFAQQIYGQQADQLDGDDNIEQDEQV